MRQPIMLVVCGALLLLACAAAADPSAPESDPRLLELRHQFAMRWLEPDPHMELARYLHDRGDRLQAFFIIESARRTRFPAEVFDEAFARVFRGEEPFDNSPAAQAAARAQVEAHPDDVAAVVHLADIHISREEYDLATPLLERAIGLQPERFANWDALAEVRRRQGRPDEAQALIERFDDEHPNAPGGWTGRAAPLMESDPAAAEEILRHGVAMYPQDPVLLFNLGIVRQRLNDQPGARAAYDAAAAAGPDIPHIQGWTARYLLKVANDREAALERYLTAYFLDPHFYDSEYAESRIRSLAWDRADERLDAAKAAGISALQLLADADPVLVTQALDRLAETWSPELVVPLQDLMLHDDPSLRWAASALLMEHADSSFDTRIAQLLEDPDLRRRGLAAYIAACRWGIDSIPHLQPLLASEAQLVRYDAISALLQEVGVPAHAALRARLPTEPHPMLRQIIEAYTAPVREENDGGG